MNIKEFGTLQVAIFTLIRALLERICILKFVRFVWLSRVNHMEDDNTSEYGISSQKKKHLIGNNL